MLKKQIEIVKDYPPNYDEICKRIPGVKKNKAIVFTYGNIVYSPMFDTLGDHLMAHEEVHVERQGDNPAAWWRQYLDDPEFRLKEEVAAYQAQYQYLIKYYDRSWRRKIVRSIAADLSGPMYGSIITKQQAIQLIKESDK